MAAWLQALLEAARPVLVPVAMVWGSPVTALEIVAFGLSLAMVLANLRVHVVAWPLAIAASLGYALLFADARLYGEAALQFVFVATALWGWWQWQRGHAEDGGRLDVHRLAPRVALLAGLMTAVAWPLVGLLLDRATDSDVPYLDALATVGSVTGTLLLARKCIENWLVWIAVNAFSVGLFAFKGLWLTTALYALFAVLSVAGWRAWSARLLHHG